MDIVKKIQKDIKNLNIKVEENNILLKKILKELENRY